VAVSTTGLSILCIAAVVSIATQLKDIVGGGTTTTTAAAASLVMDVAVAYPSNEMRSSWSLAHFGKMDKKERNFNVLSLLVEIEFLARISPFVLGCQHNETQLSWTPQETTETMDNCITTSQEREREREREKEQCDA
jgi:hypothetical protein